MNIPPSASKRLAIDFDGTIFPFGPMMGTDPPLPKAVQTIQALKADGWTIIIFTSRMSPTWWNAEGWEPKTAYRTQLNYVETKLKMYDIPYDIITAEKIPCQYYIDDRAITFDGDWGVIADRFLGGT